MDFWRQRDLFSPDDFGEKQVHIVGAGATGSFVAFLLAKMGVTNIHVWDFDIIEDHNLPNQMYRIDDIGKPKVEALGEVIEAFTGIKITPHNEVVTKDTELNGIVFLLVDSMEVRKEIWDGAIKYNLGIELMVETRLAISTGMIYSINPCLPDEIAFWESNWYPDKEAEESACSNRAISPTVSLIASYAVWKLLKFHRGEDINKELVVSMQPPILMSK